jgi:hypothetical protein
MNQPRWHASIQTTADIYAHLDLADLAEALQIVAERRADRRDRMQNDSDRFSSATRMVTPFDGGGGNRTRVSFRSL